ncbi:MAG: aminotransferase class V-fold PLP-dependent enzyme [Myxococcales bacterium]|nr:aminotransferase class V-fold PLP-dependent enzyme [Myxococcales bacterium]
MTESFGRSMRVHWAFEEGWTYLNHGTVGAPPRAVLAAQRRLADAIEAQPSRFLLRELAEVTLMEGGNPAPRMRVAAEAVAARLGAAGPDLVFVDNTTTGVNAVLRSFPFQQGDEIVLTDHTYGAVERTARFVARARGVSIRQVEIPFPPTDPAQVVRLLDEAITSATRIAVVDHITSDTGLVLPIAEIAELCRQRGVPLLVDGAHAPGCIPLDIASIGATWYVGNLHKWAWTPRSSAVLWCHPDRQSELHPVVISWGLDLGYTAEFDLVGTRDPTPHLTAPTAFELMDSFGVERVVAYNTDLARRAAEHLSAAWGTAFDVPRDMVASMVTVRLPDRFRGAGEASLRVRQALFDHKIEVHTAHRQEQLYVRVGTQIYNDLEDVDRLARAVLEL